MAIVVTALWKVEAGKPPTKLSVPVAQIANDPGDAHRFDAQLLEIARTYENYGRVDDETRWAPELCRMPMPSRARVSGSGDQQTHGQKLYFVFAKDHTRYGYGLGSEPQPVGQVIVKEAWRPDKVDSEQKPDIRRDTVAAARTNAPKGEELLFPGSYYPYASKDGALYRAKEKTGLFIMLKVDSKLPGTDHGWVYGTVTADGRTVTASGRVASCMQCHQETQHDRFFGLPPADHRLLP